MNYLIGTGRVHQFIINKLFDFEKSLNQGAINFPTFQPGGWRLSRYTESGYFDADLPLKKWSKQELRMFLYGKEQKPQNPTNKWHKTAKYVGVIPRIEDSFLKKETKSYNTEISQVTEEVACSLCHGSRLNQKALSAKIMDTNISECSLMPLDKLKDWLTEIKDSKVTLVVEELITKISNLQTVGLGYLSLNRGTATLSGGEAQRLKLANYPNSPLNDILYIFDEPSTGLHPHDLEGINKIFLQLRNKGNTVVVVDHDPDVIKIADQIFNLGEFAGQSGGAITYEGDVAGLLTSDTLTGKYLRDKGQLTSPKQLKKYDDFYTLKDVSRFNIKHLSVNFPKKSLTVVTGVAGSGKSTLIDIFKENILIRYYLIKNQSTAAFDRMYSHS